MAVSDIDGALVGGAGLDPAGIREDRKLQSGCGGKRSAVESGIKNKNEKTIPEKRGMNFHSSFFMTCFLFQTIRFLFPPLKKDSMLAAVSFTER